jgi:hypothetical protein
MFLFVFCPDCLITKSKEKVVIINLLHRCEVISDTMYLKKQIG